MALRNSLQRRNHKERGQLAHRSRLGLLEKAKDFRLRARDYNSKKDRIKRLREKASMRNKDEFYFGMVNNKTEGGVHYKSRGNAALPVEMVKILKTQDANYIRTQRSVGQHKIEKLKQQLAAMADLVPSASAPGPSSSSSAAALDDWMDDDGFDSMEEDELEAETGGMDSDDDEDAETEAASAQLDEQEQATLRAVGLLEEKSGSRKGKGRAVPKKIVFKESEDEVRSYAPASTSRSSEFPSSTSSTSAAPSTTPDLGWLPKPLTSKQRRRAAAVPAMSSAERKKLTSEDILAARKHRLSLLRSLRAHLVRDAQLAATEREMALQRALMGKGAAKKLENAKRVEVENDEEGDDDEEADERGGTKGEWRARRFKWKAERRR